MKKIVSSYACAALLAAGLTAPIAPLAAQSDNAAEILKDGSCGGFVPDADGNIGSLLFTADGAHAAATSSGNVTLICEFDIPEGQEPATATLGSGFGCGTPLGFTTDSKMVASPGGKATLICKVRSDS